MERIGRGLSPRTTNADISALRLFFADAMGQPDKVEGLSALQKKQASAFQLQPGIRGEVRLVERAFGIGPGMMSELMSLRGAELEQIAIQQGS